MKILKKIIAIMVAAIVCAATATAQQIQVTYLQTPKQNLQNAESIPAPVLEMMMKNLTKTFTLCHSGNESCYKQIDSDDKNSSGKMTSQSFGGYKSSYRNFETKELLSAGNIMGENVVVENTINERSPWPDTIAGCEILGYACKGVQKEIPIGNGAVEYFKVWYCPDIDIHDGPDGYLGFPGMVLKIETSSYAIEAKEINENTSCEIEKVKGKKRITQSEYNEQLKAKMKELGIDEAGGKIVKKKKSTSIQGNVDEKVINMLKQRGVIDSDGNIKK